MTHPVFRSYLLISVLLKVSSPSRAVMVLDNLAHNFAPTLLKPYYRLTIQLVQNLLFTLISKLPFSIRSFY